MILNLMILSIITSCKKDRRAESSLSQKPGNFISIVDGFNVQLQWVAPNEEFDNYTLQFSKSSDFSILEYNLTIDKTKNSHILRNIDAGDNYYARIRSNRAVPMSSSDWVNLDFIASKGNILLPINRENVKQNTVDIKWEFLPTDQTIGKVSRIVVIPNSGQSFEIQLTAQHIQNKSVTFDKLLSDVRYTVRIYNEDFLRGTQIFTTIALPANGVWTLSPHSDLKAAIETSKTGDKIILKEGVYNFWNESILIENKNITISTAAGSVSKPKVYVGRFIIQGMGTGIAFNGLDLSGTRVNDFKQELDNNADTRWNNTLLSMEGSSSTFDQISFENCIIRNYNSGLLKMLKGQTGNNFNINNSIVHQMGDDQSSPLIEVGAARIKEGVFSNSTYYKAGKMFISIDREANPNNDIFFTFKNNTVDRSWNASGFDFKASKLPTKALFENNIFSNITCAANLFSNFSQPANNFDKRLINCNFYNVVSKATVYGSNQSNMPVHTWELRHPNFKWNDVLPSFIMNDGGHVNPNSIKEYPMSFNPDYRNAAALDFTIPVGSAMRNAVPGVILGDPRWW